MKINLWAVLSKEEDFPGGAYNIVVLYTLPAGHIPIVSTLKRSVEKAFKMLDPEVREASRIVHFVAEV